MKKLRFLVSLLTKANHYQKQQEAAARQAAAHLGVEVEVLDPGNDAITQSEQLLNAIQSPSHESRFDGILCYPVGTTLVQVARQAAAMGMGWAILNRECDYIAELCKISPTPFFSITTNNAEIGHIQGRQIGALRPEGGLVLHLIGPSVSSIAQLRSTGMQATKPANVQIRTLAGDWSEQSGYKAVTRWLQLKTSGDTPVTLVAAQNDDMAMGARRAFEDQTSGAQRERWTNLPYIGCDCCPGAGREWVRKGLLTASITNPSTAGLALEIMVQAIRTNTQPAERTMVEPASHPSVETLAGTLTQTGAS